MREIYHAELDDLTARTIRLAEMVELEMGRATAALLDNDLALAERVIDSEPVVTRHCHELDDAAVLLLARQQPVATDLRLIVASLRASGDLERMGRLARHVAELVRQRHPLSVVPDQLRDTINRMGEIAARITVRAATAVARRDVRIAAEVAREDAEMNRLQQALYRHLLGSGSSGDTGLAMDVALIGRYYERYADHATSLAGRIAYVVGDRSGQTQPAG